MPRKRWLYICGGLLIGGFYIWRNDVEGMSSAGPSVRIMLMTACSLLAFLLVYFEKARLLVTSLGISVGVFLAIACWMLLERALEHEPYGGWEPVEFWVAPGMALLTSIIGGLMANVARMANKPVK